MISHTLIQSIGLAFFLYLTFEAPSVNLMKLAFKSNSRSNSQKIIPNKESKEEKEEIEEEIIKKKQ